MFRSRQSIFAKLLAGMLYVALASLPGADASAQRIVIKGSNTFGEELAPALIKRFGETHPDVSIELESKGSASGFQALLAGECDIASSSRAINEDELRLAKSHKITLRDHFIGLYGVAVVVNEANPIEGLTHKQVRDIFTGAITNWKAVGGSDAPIHLYIRDPVSGTYLGFQELAMERKPYASSAKMLTRYADIVSELRSDPHGIGYSSPLAAKTKGVKALGINGITITISTVNDGAYPYARTLRLYTNRNRESDKVREFVRFIIGRRGQDILSELGFVRRFETPAWSPEL